MLRFGPFKISILGDFAKPLPPLRYVIPVLIAAAAEGRNPPAPAKRRAGWNRATALTLVWLRAYPSRP